MCSLFLCAFRRAFNGCIRNSAFISFNVKTFHHLRNFVGKYKYNAEEPCSVLFYFGSADRFILSCHCWLHLFPLFFSRKKWKHLFIYRSVMRERGDGIDLAARKFFFAGVPNGHRQQSHCAHKTRGNTQNMPFQHFHFNIIFLCEKSLCLFLQKVAVALTQ